MNMEYSYIETNRLILRKCKASDLEPIWKNAWIHPEVAEFMLQPVTNTLEEAKDRLRRTHEYQKYNEAYFVCLKDNDEPIGFCGIRKLDEGVYADSGICIGPKYQGKGYGKEVVKALCKQVFGILGGGMFFYSCFKENTKSANLCKSLGFEFFKEENLVRDYDNLEYVSESYYMSSDMYEKLAENW